MDIKSQVIDYLEKKKPIPGDSTEEKLKCLYLEAGIVDSMGIIELIGEMENRFDIEFDHEEMQSYEFQTVGGLIGIIERHLAARES